MRAKTTISSKLQLVDFSIAEIWRYRDLVFLFVRRDFVSFYKQTILGPVWVFLQPLMNTFAFTIVFYKIVGIGTGNRPPVLFYLSGLIFWTYFMSCFTKSSDVFVTNAHLFGKVYFPRVTVAIATTISNLINFAIQLFLLFCVFMYYRIQGEVITPSSWSFLIPVNLLFLALLGLGCGLTVSAWTIKYRDFSFLIGPLVSIWMYLSPVIYPFSRIPEAWQGIFLLNPLTPQIEFARFALLGGEYLYWSELMRSYVICALIFLFGFLVFHRAEKSFVDTV